MRMRLKPSFLTPIILLLLLISCQSVGEEKKISGGLKDGLRYLEIEAEANSIDFDVYRGDYIIFKFSDQKQHKLNIPELNINLSLPIPKPAKPYLKMKNIGTFNFTLDGKKGVLRVHSYSQPYYQELSSKEAFDIIKNTSPFILDVRTQYEYDQGHLNSAHLLPVQLLTKKIAELSKYRESDIVIYCRSGNRSTVAAKILIDNGFKKIYNIRYGIGDWQQKGFPVVVK